MCRKHSGFNEGCWCSRGSAGRGPCGASAWSCCCFLSVFCVLCLGKPPTIVGHEACFWWIILQGTTILTLLMITWKISYNLPLLDAVHCSVPFDSAGQICVRPFSLFYILAICCCFSYLFELMCTYILFSSQDFLLFALRYKIFY